MLVKLGAVWSGTDKNGNPMLSGKIGDARVVILQNNYKEADNHPDYIIYVTNPQKRDDSGDNDNQPSQTDIPF